MLKNIENENMRKIFLRFLFFYFQTWEKFKKHIKGIIIIFTTAIDYQAQGFGLVE